MKSPLVKNTVVLFLTIMFPLLANAADTKIEDVWAGQSSEIMETKYGQLEMHPNQSYLDGWLRTLDSAKVDCLTMGMRFDDANSGILRVSTRLIKGEIVKNIINLADGPFQYVAVPEYDERFFEMALYTVDGQMTPHIIRCITPEQKKK